MLLNKEGKYLLCLYIASNKQVSLDAIEVYLSLETEKQLCKSTARLTVMRQIADTDTSLHKTIRHYSTVFLLCSRKHPWLLGPNGAVSYPYHS